MSSSEPSAVAFLRTAALAVLGGATALTAAAALIDPLGLLAARPDRAAGLHAPGRHGSPLCAPGLKVEDDPVHLARLAAALRPAEAVLGSSRAREGFPAIPGRDIANLAVSGGRMAEIAALARAAGEGGRLRRVFVVLDFTAFVTPRSETVPGAAARPARLPPALVAVASPQAWAGVLQVAARPERCAAPFRDAQGFQPARRPTSRVALPHRWGERLDGRLNLSPRDRERVYRLEQGRLAALARALAADGVEVVLVVAPFASTYEARVTAAGLDPWRRRWREDLDALAVATGARVVDAGPVDDAGFLDPVHFGPQVGRRVLDAVPPPAAPSGFSRRP